MMSIVAKDSGGGGFQRELPEPGIHHAVCSKVFDLGMQAESYNNENSWRHKALVVWELDQTIEDKESEYYGKRLLVHNEYTVSLNEKSKLRKHLESWRGREFTDEELMHGFDIEKLIAVQCQLNIVIRKSGAGRDYSRVESVAPAGKNAPIMTPELPEDWCPDWIKQKIAEGKGAGGDVSKREFEDEEIPF
jgi:hypothetical protein